MPRTGIRRAAATAGAIATAGALGATGIAQAATPPAGVTGLLLGRSDLGPGWSVSAPAPARIPAIACGKLHLQLRGGAAHPAAAASPTFQQNGTGVFLGQTAYRYATAAEAQQVWGGVARRALLGCLAQSVAAGSTRSVRFTVSSERMVPAPRVEGASVVAFRVLATAHESGGVTADAYFDELLLRARTVLSALSFSSLAAPPSVSLERRIAGRAAGRLDKKTT
jgi:hypothetical protein